MLKFKIKKYNKWYYSKKDRKRIDIYIKNMSVKEKNEIINYLYINFILSNNITILFYNHWQDIPDIKLSMLEKNIEKSNGKIGYIYRESSLNLYGYITIKKDKLDFNIFENYLKMMDNFSIYDTRLIVNSNDISNYNTRKKNQIIQEALSQYNVQLMFDNEANELIVIIKNSIKLNCPDLIKFLRTKIK